MLYFIVCVQVAYERCLLFKVNIMNFPKKYPKLKKISYGFCNLLYTKKLIVLFILPKTLVISKENKVVMIKT